MLRAVVESLEMDPRVWGLWVYGRMALWLYGFMGLGVYGFWVYGLRFRARGLRVGSRHINFGRRAVCVASGTPPPPPPPQTLNLNPKPQTPNPKPQTPNPKPQTPTPNPKPQTLNRYSWVRCLLAMLAYMWAFSKGPFKGWTLQERV